MSYFMNNLMGESIDDPDEDRIRAVLGELEQADDEHPDVALEHESGWSLSVLADKTIIWENVEDDDAEPREATLSDWDAVVAVLLKLARGDIEGVEQTNWN